MKLAVIGLGSMGKRRIRLIQQLCDNAEITGIDSNCDRCREAEKLYSVRTSESIEDAYKEQDFDAAIVCTSPLSHSKIIHSVLDYGSHVFTELNLVSDGYSENIKLAKEKNLILFLSSTLLHRKEIKYIKSVLTNNIHVNYIYHVGQYLPDWHPWENYKDFFVNDRRTNGCREIMAIELPWMSDVFSEITSATSISGNITTLDIDYPDFFNINIKHKNGTSGVLCVDVASKKAVRNLEIFGEDMHISWKGTPDSLYEVSGDDSAERKINLYDQVESLDSYNATIIEDAYTKELEDFFDLIRGNKVSMYTFEKDRMILDLIDKLEGICK